MANIFHVEREANKITLGTTGTTINIASHTASKLLALDASKNLEVVTIGTSLSYARPTLNTIQDIRTTASPTFTGLDLTGTLTVDTINEHTGATGVTIEGILIKDSDIWLSDYDTIYFGDGPDYALYYDSNRLIFTRTAGTSEVWIGSSHGETLMAGHLFSDGNMGIGSSAMRHTWKTWYDVLEIGGTGALYCNTTLTSSMQIGLAQNAYYDDTDSRWEYACTDEASLYAQVHGQHLFYVDDGTGAGAGNAITFTLALTINDAANALFTGAISSGTLTITASAGDTDVSGVNTVFINSSGVGNDIDITGFANGVTGQVIYVSIIDHTNTITMKHNDGGGTQKLMLHDSSDEALTDLGGWVFTFNGTYWYDVSHAKHV